MVTEKLYQPHSRLRQLWSMMQSSSQSGPTGASTESTSTAQTSGNASATGQAQGVATGPDGSQAASSASAQVTACYKTCEVGGKTAALLKILGNAEGLHDLCLSQNDLYPRNFLCMICEITCKKGKQ